MPTAIHLKDYAPPAFKVVHVELSVNLAPENTIIDSVLTVEHNAEHGQFVLDGEGLELLSLKLDGRLLTADAAGT